MPQRRAQWSESSLQAAMAAVERGQLSQRAAADRHGIPRRTLRNHLRTGDPTKRLGRSSIMSTDQENELVERIIKFGHIGMPLTSRQIRRQAFVFCKKYNIKNNFSEQSGLAQKLNRPIVKQHFDEVKKLYEELDIVNHPERLYNMDEKGCRLTIHHQQSVLAQRGSKRLHMIAPEHAENVTVAMCANAVGNFIPPMIIFKGQRLKPEFNDNLPTGSIVRMAAKGSMTTQLFIDFIKHLVKHKTTGKTLLIFDGASSHLDYEIVDEAEKHDIVLYCLPSNTTHELQPLDKSINKSFEHFWDQEVLTFLYQSPDRKITKARFNGLFTKVWSKCMTHQNIVNGFRATGLYPLNPDILPDEAFAPSILTEIQANPTNESNAASIEILPDGFDSEALIHGSSHLLSDENISGEDICDRDEGRANSCPRRIDIDSDETVCEDEDSNSNLRSKISTTASNDIVLDQEHQDLPILNKVTTDKPSSPSILATSPNNVELEEHQDRPILKMVTPEKSQITPIKSPQPGCSGIQTIRLLRPILQSSDTDTDDENLFDMQAFIHRQRHPTKIRIYSSDENDNQKDGKENDSKQNFESEDDIPLAALQTGNQRTAFQELLPTPNYAVIKKKPRRKALNYKGQRVTKDLFKDKGHKKDNKTQKKTNKKTEKVKKMQSTETCQKSVIEKRNKKGSKAGKDKGKMKRTKKTVIEDKWYCNACNEERISDMRMCQLCSRWFHEECVGFTEEDSESYVCHDCE